MHYQSSGFVEPLAAVIALLRPRAVLSKIISGAGAWSICYDAQEHPGFGIILEGGCFLEVKGVGKIALREGDFVLLTSTPGFKMASDLKLPATLVQASNPRELRHGAKTGRPSMRMLGGYFDVDRDNAQFVLRFLPPVVHIRASGDEANRVRRLTELIAEEAMATRPGRELILHRLVEVLLVEAMRYRSSTSGVSPRRLAGRGLLAGLADEALARPLRRMHADVPRRWTLPELAKLAGMSRAVFAERFHRTVGTPPMRYLLELRMAVAKDLLRSERLPLATIADMVGYQSASAFSTAFSRLTGRAPSVFAAQR